MDLGVKIKRKWIRWSVEAIENIKYMNILLKN